MIRRVPSCMALAACVPSTLVALALGTMLPGTGCAAEVSGVRFDPPRLYLTHASLNKGGTLAALRDQDNFLSLYMPPVDNAKSVYSADGFKVVVLLPGILEILDQAEQGLSVASVQYEGKPYLQVSKQLDPAEVANRCFRNSWGMDIGPLWYRVRKGIRLSDGPLTVRVTLNYGERECFADQAPLKVYEALESGPRVSPAHFRLWLHYGPHHRPGHWDELAYYLKLAGINGIQVTAGGPGAVEYAREMRRRGFYIIAQRSESYEEIYKDNMRTCLAQEKKWFEKADRGVMTTYLPFSDAALWDFEPSPLPTGLDDWLVGQFRQAEKIPASEPLTEATIRAKYLRRYIEFRQGQLAACVKHWADYCRSVKPDIQTILTEGSALTFDPPGQVDYSKYQDYVTFCDPMNFTGIQALQVLRQWQQRAPRARFTGCQNVALSHRHHVFVSPQTIQMQILSAALIGLHGTSIYPGWAMDAENFVAMARATEFLGRHERLVYDGRRAPAEAKIAFLPKEEQELALGDGRKVRNAYPDWEREAITCSYAAPDGGEFLAVVANWHAKEPAYGKLTLSLPEGAWLLADDENRRLLTCGGTSSLDAGLLAKGVFVLCPAFDFRGFHALRYTPAAMRALEGYRPQSLEEWSKEAQSYSAQPPTVEGEPRLLFHLGFDGTTEPLVARGDKRVVVTGAPTYEDTSGGKAIRMTRGVSLSYLPAGNINLQRGRLAIRFKPLWEGAENQDRLLLTVQPKTGFMYLGKLADGRFLMNMFDPQDRQHWGFHSIRTMPANTWHDATVTWDIGRGTSLLFLDGKKVVEYRADPWQMADLDNSLAHCRLVFPEGSDVVIDDMKVWDRP